MSFDIVQVICHLQGRSLGGLEVERSFVVIFLDVD
ncbi:hypothetical protein CsSME_00032542 [Camellia sinensis var. sinensis]